MASAVCLGFGIGFTWADRRTAKELLLKKATNRAVDRTPVVEQSLGPDFGGIAKIAEAIQKLTPSGQLLIGAIAFAVIAAVLGGVGTVTGI